MPFKKKPYRKKPPTRRNRRVSIPKSMNSAKMHAKLTCSSSSEQNISNDNLVNQTMNIQFYLNKCTNFLAYTTLYDQYRINSVVVKFIPTMAEVVSRQYDDGTTGDLTEKIPSLFVVLDRDDDNYLTSEDQARGFRLHKRTTATKGQQWKFKPNTLQPVFRTGVTSAYSVAYNTWLDCSYADVPHFGLKCLIEPAEPRNAYNYRVETTYYVSFKGRKQ